MNTVIDTRVRRIRRITASSAGAALESYEWSLYALLVTYFSPRFFGGDLQHSVLYGFGIFAVGFLIRPIGALVLGQLADRRGRRPALVLSIGLAGVATLGMALTPGHETIGAGAPILLLVWRLVLGFSFGGEQAVAQAYLYESAPPKRRMLGTSVYSIFYGLGTITANLLVAGLATTAGTDALRDGYWRIPFLVAGVLSLAFMLARRSIPETLDSELHEQPVRWRREWRSLLGPSLAVAGLTAGTLASYYLWVSAPTSYAITVLKLPDGQVLWAGVLAQVGYMAAAPLFGALADRVGPLRWVAGAALVLAALTLPMQILLNSATPVTYWVLMVVGSIGVVTLAATVTGATAMVAPARHRVTVMALPYSITSALFGGTTPALKTKFAAHPALFSLYIIALLLITTITALAAKPLFAKAAAADEKAASVTA
ncbi:MHS family alpha-ketoglutarate permease-like MFS transporter [Nocardia transvalensis]|uniref:MHS family alpha-ketoglutarate permease-like MFS transporter n=1 Tax=Nocardia transvalensis TaxID=37333 RepID=A0A7W9PI16_9NOCA|nr:MFS transporter [Nocardia transvalensis]MBB5915908.1 MHS family alpha-ketoglutarate permease-like MFS transporter [Nocardia transvalensis]